MENEKIERIAAALFESCSHCRGSGWVEDPDWAAWWQTHNNLPPQGHYLLDLPEEYLCPECSGIGEILTNYGKKIWRLIKNYQTRCKDLEEGQHER